MTDLGKILGTDVSGFGKAIGITDTSVGKIVGLEWVHFIPIGLFGGGSTSLNVIEYVLITTTGNSTDFGDLTVERYS